MKGIKKITIKRMDTKFDKKKIKWSQVMINDFEERKINLKKIKIK
jgi:hypothetical protein